MSKRILIVFMLAVGVLALRSGNVDAHLSGWTYSPTARHVSSYDIFGHFSQVPNLTQHPAIFETVLEVHEAVVYCVNPQGKFTDGVPTGPWVALGENPFKNADLDKKVKGRALKSIHFESEVLPWWDDSICSARNLNWRVGDELIMSMRVHLWTYDCGDAECSPSLRTAAFHAELECTNPGMGRTDIFDYACTLENEEHCDQIEGGCTP